jgi:small GTP-binding protein
MTNVLLIGDSLVGKTSIFMRLSGLQFTESYISTIGKDMKVVEFGSRRFIIHDTAGADRFSGQVHLYYKFAHYVIFVYDVNNVSSLQHLYDKWIPTIQKENPDVAYTIVGNKLEGRREEMDEDHICISCKTGYNIDLLKSYILQDSPEVTNEEVGFTTSILGMIGNGVSCAYL